MEDLRKSSKL